MVYGAMQLYCFLKAFVYVYLCACVPACLRACVNLCVRACMLACVRACVRACVCFFTSVCLCARMQVWKPTMLVECLVSDFAGMEASVATLALSGLDVSLSVSLRRAAAGIFRPMPPRAARIGLPSLRDPFPIPTIVSNSFQWSDA